MCQSRSKDEEKNAIVSIESTYTSSWSLTYHIPASLTRKEAITSISHEAITFISRNKTTNHYPNIPHDIISTSNNFNLKLTTPELVLVLRQSLTLAKSVYT